ncbi:DUF559 domain-containing protein [Shewanella oncorhynchi]|uniref:DUF559 domain-containing protein n=1 Tax=Shewanella oncorhynchi TaxID=2726434 RepID=A0AA50KHP2_9GAMM|nr:DUF559 domain-containing protein [Shewanella oncorhynchi]WMB74807.1 DUF559 domain-containing protein [Shewanella oncorhynchi]
MKYPGQPKSTPGWYRDRGESYIEKEFSKELGDLADAIESEHWFGDQEKHGRYRVDFILKDARLIIELDGHDYHSTKEQLEKDAIRQRYLSRAGYTVIRFTGREINKDPKACVAEVREIYKERMQRAPAKYRVMYIDYPFLYRETSKALSFFKKLHPDRELKPVSVDELIPHAVEWLHEKSFITAFVFHPPEDEHEIKHLDGFVKEFDKGEVRINTMSEEWYSLELGDHMKNFSHLFDEFYLMADDPVYVDPLRSVLPSNLSEKMIGDYKFNYLANGKLLRHGNENTSYVGSELVYVQWQRLWYVIGASMGLSLYEM